MKTDNSRETDIHIPANSESADASSFFIGEVMSFNLADILEAVGKLVVTLDQHPSGAVYLIALAPLIGMPALVWLLKR